MFSKQKKKQPPFSVFFFISLLTITRTRRLSSFEAPNSDVKTPEKIGTFIANPQNASRPGLKAAWNQWVFQVWCFLGELLAGDEGWRRGVKIDVPVWR